MQEFLDTIKPHSVATGDSGLSIGGAPPFLSPVVDIFLPFGGIALVCCIVFSPFSLLRELIQFVNS